MERFSQGGLTVAKSKITKLHHSDKKIKKEKEKTLEHADALYDQVKNRAYEIYEEGKKTASHAQDNLKHYTDNLTKYVRERPISSLLIASGIGFILSSLLRKK